MSYELKKDKTGKFMFNLKAGNGQVILTSESYPQKDAAMNGINSVRANGPLDKSYETKSSTSGQAFFVLKGVNGEVIGRSEMYSSEAARDKGIASAKTNSTSTEVDDQTGA